MVSWDNSPSLCSHTMQNVCSYPDPFTFVIPCWERNSHLTHVYTVFSTMGLPVTTVI